MSVYMKLLNAVDCGYRFNINLKDKVILLNGKKLLLEEQLIKKDDLIYLGIYESEPWKILEELYARYKTSAPSARYYGNKPYFKADKDIELSDADIAFNSPRNYAQAALEGYVLLASMNGDLQWQNESNWFWQSKLYKEMIILKEWM